MYINNSTYSFSKMQKSVSTTTVHLREMAMRELQKELPHFPNIVLWYSKKCDNDKKVNKKVDKRIRSEVPIVTREKFLEHLVTLYGYRKIGHCGGEWFGRTTIQYDTEMYFRLSIYEDFGIDDYERDMELFVSSQPSIMGEQWEKILDAV